MCTPETQPETSSSQRRATNLLRSGFPTQSLGPFPLLEKVNNLVGLDLVLRHPRGVVRVFLMAGLLSDIRRDCVQQRDHGVAEGADGQTAPFRCPW